MLLSLWAVSLGAAVLNEVNTLQAYAPLTSDHPTVLVILSDHGSGTMEFGAALNTHPCMFNLGELFALKDTLWSNAEVPECTGAMASDMNKVIFNSETGALLKSSNPTLTTRIIAQSAHAAINGTMLMGTLPVLKRTVAHMTFAGDTAELYDHLQYSFADYVVRIRDHVCAGVPAEVCAPSDCSITLSMLPQFVNANTAGRLMRDDPPKSVCVLARNAKAMSAWKAALASMAENPNVATFKLARDERDRQFALFQEFGLAEQMFDCAIERQPSDYLAESSYPNADDQIDIEHCWSGDAGANKCLADALKLVGLSTEPMMDAGTRNMEGIQKMKASCALDPTAIFKRLANGDMQKTAATFEKIRAAEKLKAVQDGAAAAALAKDFAAAAENAAAMNLFVNGVDARAEFVKSEPAFVVKEHTVTTSDIPEMIQLNVLPETDSTTTAPTTTPAVRTEHTVTTSDIPDMIQLNVPDSVQLFLQRDDVRAQALPNQPLASVPEEISGIISEAGRANVPEIIYPSRKEEHTVTTSDIPEMIQLNVLPETDPTTAAPTTAIVVPEVVNPVIYASKLMQVGEGNMHTVSAWSQQGGWWN